MSRARRSRRVRGLTLLEVMVAIAILGMVAVLIYGAFDGLSRSKTGLSKLNDRYHVGRATIRRLAREISASFISLHVPISQSLLARKTIFSVKDQSPIDRLDMNTFSHQRVTANAKESDQNEISYYSSADPNVSGKVDLVRRESSQLDLEPTKGGTVLVVAEDVDLFDIKLLDPTTGMWTDTWDTSQAIGQPNRLPIQVRITLVLRGGKGGKPIKFEEKVPVAMLDGLTFALPK